MQRCMDRNVPVGQALVLRSKTSDRPKTSHGRPEEPETKALCRTYLGSIKIVRLKSRDKLGCPVSAKSTVTVLFWCKFQSICTAVSLYKGQRFFQLKVQLGSSGHGIVRHLTVNLNYLHGASGLQRKHGAWVSKQADGSTALANVGVCAQYTSNHSPCSSLEDGVRPIIE